MPASLQTLLYSTISFTLLILVGCSRDNPLSVPEEFVSTTVTCTTAVEDYPGLAELLITNTELNYPGTNVVDEVIIPTVETGYDPEIFEYTADVDHLYNSVVITPEPLDIEALNIALHGYNEETKTANIRPGTFRFTSIEVKLNNDVINPENQNQTLALSEDSVLVTILTRLKLEVPIEEVNSEGECVPAFTTDASGELTNIRKTEQKVQIISYTIQVNHQPRELSIQALELSDDINAANNEFSRSMSIGNTLRSNVAEATDIAAVIGAPHISTITDQVNEDSGALFVYETISKGNWEAPVLLNAAKPDTGDLFGHSVSLSNGLLAVSAPGEDSFAAGVYNWIDENDDNINDHLSVEISNVAQSSGAVYIFEKEVTEANGWKQQTFIKQPIIKPGLDDYDIGFGKNILLDDNILVIAAPQQEVVAIIDDLPTDVNSGEVYVYRYEVVDTYEDSVTEEVIDIYGWVLAATLQSENPNQGDQFGASLSMKDGYILIGAPGENNGAGAAYLFSPAGNFWEFSTHLTASNRNAGDRFGSSVALSTTKLFIGATQEDSYGQGLNRNKADNSLPNSGAVYGFSITEPEDPWVEFVYIKADAPETEAQFGYDIKFSENTLVIGEPFRENENALGQVYIFKLHDMDLQESQVLDFETLDPTISSDNQQMNGRYGSSLALFKSILAVGANGFTNRNTGESKANSGKAYIFQ